MSEQAKYSKGTWVRFYREGRMVIGVVEYTHKSIIGTLTLATDAGEVEADSVLESRQAVAKERS